MSVEHKDPILEMLREIRVKQDETLEKQDKMDARLDQIHDDCKKTARTNGAVAGAISGTATGGLVSLGIALIKAKFGL